MSDTTRNTPACDLSGIREAVCVHTDKITDWPRTASKICTCT